MSFTARDFAWAVGSACTLHRVPFDAGMVLSQIAPPYSEASLLCALKALGFVAAKRLIDAQDLCRERGAVVLFMVSESGGAKLALLGRSTDDSVTWYPAGSNEPRIDSLESFSGHYSGHAIVAEKAPEAANDPDSERAGRTFGFGWFVPELLKHKRVWRDVLGASLLLQLLALGMPLFTQAIIDKVVVHQTESTLFAIAVGMAIFMVASAVLTWVRQYLVLHTGNRVDAVLAATVFAHLFKLPPRYFEHRPTGVVAARLQGVETIREFVSSAAVMLVLDVPFLVIAAGVMLYYSVPLTIVAISILAVVCLLSAIVAPVFHKRLNEQFLLGARNQAFITEYIAGFETVKSLQFESQLQARYSGFLASFLQSGFKTKQIANTYNVIASTLEQLMTLLILLIGAWIAMHPSADAKGAFTIGMLVAFQMFAGKLSQPMMRMVGLWQQFQQSRLAVVRLGDLMNAPPEPYSLVPSRLAQGRGRIEIDGIAFRYGDDRPWLYQDLTIKLDPGKVVAIMGPSGSGKSTLAKLLQGFYQPTAGQIRIDGVDIRHLSANELRSNFGVVPQETTLFSGTIYDNLMMANAHASFEQVVHACRMAEIHAVIDGLPQGYRTPIGERGAGLSGGQKQRLAIARALLKRPRILVFDEATSALDGETAEHFAKTINALKGKVTMLFITHALPKSLWIDEVVQIGKTGARQMHAVSPQRS
jgi:ATP-binding cassette, subfamily B, bacterial HlyB/CyaB